MMAELVVQAAQADQEGRGRAAGRARLDPGRPEAARHGQRAQRIDQRHLEDVQHQHALWSRLLGGERRAQAVVELVELPGSGELLAQGLQEVGVAGSSQPRVGEELRGQDHDPPASPREREGDRAALRIAQQHVRP
jgi:hypothetical protein